MFSLGGPNAAVRRRALRGRGVRRTRPGDSHENEALFSARHILTSFVVRWHSSAFVVVRLFVVFVVCLPSATVHPQIFELLSAA